MQIKRFKFSSQVIPVVQFISNMDQEAEKTIKIGRNAAKQVAEKLHELKPFLYGLVTGEKIVKFEYDSLIHAAAQKDAMFRLMITGVSFTHDLNGDLKTVKLEGQMGVPGKKYQVKIQTDKIELEKEAGEFTSIVYEVYNTIEDWIKIWDKLTQTQPDLFTNDEEVKVA